MKFIKDRKIIGETIGIKTKPVLIDFKPEVSLLLSRNGSRDKGNNSLRS